VNARAVAGLAGAASLAAGLAGAVAAVQAYRRLVAKVADLAADMEDLDGGLVHLDRKLDQVAQAEAIIARATGRTPPPPARRREHLQIIDGGGS
jgi:hypothetical protein